MTCEQNVGQNHNKDMWDINISNLCGCRAVASTLDALYNVYSYQCFRGFCCFHLQGTKWWQHWTSNTMCSAHSESYSIHFIVFHSCISSEVWQDFFASQGSISAGENCPLPPPHGDLASMRQLDKLYIVINEVVSVINFIEARSLKDKILKQMCSDTGSDYMHFGWEN